MDNLASAWLPHTLCRSSPPHRNKRDNRTNKEDIPGASQTRPPSSPVGPAGIIPSLLRLGHSRAAAPLDPLAPSPLPSFVRFACSCSAMVPPSAPSFPPSLTSQHYGAQSTATTPHHPSQHYGQTRTLGNSHWEKADQAMPHRSLLFLLRGCIEIRLVCLKLIAHVESGRDWKGVRPPKSSLWNLVKETLNCT